MSRGYPAPNQPYNLSGWGVLKPDGTIDPCNGDPRLPPRGYQNVSQNPLVRRELGQTRQIFGSYNQLAFDPAIPFPPENTGETYLYSHATEGLAEALWILSVNAIEVRRIGNDLSPLSREQILNQGLRYSCLQARATWADSSADGREFFFDVRGGTNFMFYGRNVNISILCPADVVEINSSQQSIQAGTKSGVVIDAIVSAKIGPANECRCGTNTQKFTIPVFVSAVAGNVFTPIPPGAERVRIEEVTAGGAGTTANFWSGPTAAFFNVGVIDFVTTHGTDDILIPQTATHIRSPTAAAANRAFEYIFIVEP